MDAAAAVSTLSGSYRKLIILRLVALWSFSRVLFWNYVNGFLRVVRATARHDRQFCFRCFELSSNSTAFSRVRADPLLISFSLMRVSAKYNAISYHFFRIVVFGDQ